MDKLKQIETFVAVAQRGSLTAAAQSEGVAAAMVGRRLDALEARLGVKLLVRTTRRISLTHEGAAFLEESVRILGDIANMEAAVSAGSVRASGQLRLTAPAGFGRRHVAPLVPRFHELHPTKQSDWLRLYLVALHGGFWLDASTLLTRSLGWMQAAVDSRTEFVGFYLEKFTTQVQRPVIESWAFGALAGSDFIVAWQREFHQALIVEGTEAYLQRLQARSDWAGIRQNIGDPHYLLIHITAQQVLRQRQYSRMALFKAEDSAYYYHRALRWKWYLLYPQLCRVQGPKISAPIVKLRGGERRHFTEMFKAHGGAVPGSTWHRALNPEA